MLKKKKNEKGGKSVQGNIGVEIYYLNFWTDNTEMLGKSNSPCWKIFLLFLQLCILLHIHLGKWYFIVPTDKKWNFSVFLGK